MKTFRKVLAIAFLTVSILISGPNVDFAGAQDTSARYGKANTSALAILALKMGYRITPLIA